MRVGLELPRDGRAQPETRPDHRTLVLDPLVEFQSSQRPDQMTPTERTSKYLTAISRKMKREWTKVTLACGRASPRQHEGELEPTLTSPLNDHRHA